MKESKRWCIAIPLGILGAVAILFLTWAVINDCPDTAGVYVDGC